MEDDAAKRVKEMAVLGQLRLVVQQFWQDRKHGSFSDPRVRTPLRDWKRRLTRAIEGAKADVVSEAESRVCGVLAKQWRELMGLEETGDEWSKWCFVESVHRAVDVLLTVHEREGVEDIVVQEVEEESTGTAKSMHHGKIKQHARNRASCPAGPSQSRESATKGDGGAGIWEGAALARREQ
jgi:hypothetical protein